jgi:hypothetical protein
MILIDIKLILKQYHIGIIFILHFLNIHYYFN